MRLGLEREQPVLLISALFFRSSDPWTRSFWPLLSLLGATSTRPAHWRLPCHQKIKTIQTLGGALVLLVSRGSCALEQRFSWSSITVLATQNLHAPDCGCGRVRKLRETNTDQSIRSDVSEECEWSTLRSITSKARDLVRFLKFETGIWKEGEVQFSRPWAT